MLNFKMLEVILILLEFYKASYSFLNSLFILELIDILDYL